MKELGKAKKELARYWCTGLQEYLRAWEVDMYSPDDIMRNTNRFIFHFIYYPGNEVETGICTYDEVKYLANNSNQEEIADFVRRTVVYGDMWICRRDSTWAHSEKEPKFLESVYWKMVAADARTKEKFQRCSICGSKDSVRIVYKDLLKCGEEVWDDSNILAACLDCRSVEDDEIQTSKLPPFEALNIAEIPIPVLSYTLELLKRGIPG